MSASPMARHVTEGQAIPKRVVITDPQDLPDVYSSTPGGTLYSTTPGGSKIVYERAFLMNLRNSPISKTPPKWGDIPDELVRGSPKNGNSHHQRHHQRLPPQKPRSPLISTNDDQDQFQLDM